MGKKIVIIGGGIVETDGDKYFCRSQLLEYLIGFCAYYSSVTWAVRQVNSNNYSTVIDGSNRISIDIINTKRKNILSLMGIWDQLLHYLHFMRRLDRSTDVIVNDYSLTTLPYLVLVRLFGHRALFYLGSDPLLTSVLRKDTLYGRVLSGLNRMLLPITLKLAHGVLVRGKSTFEQCQRWNSKIILSNPLIAYGCFIKDRFEKPPKKHIDVLQILYVGKLEPNKGVNILIQALNVIEKKYNDLPCRLNIIGSGVLEKELHDLAEHHRVVDKVIFYGFIDDSKKLSEVFRKCDLLVVPTVFAEGFPRVIDEAMACGLPVICSRLGGMKGGLEESEVFFVEPGNVDEIADAIMKIKENDTFRRQLQQNSILRTKKMLKVTASQQHIEFMFSI